MEAGSRVFVHYDIPGDPTWHERLLCGLVEHAEWVVVTPDLDSFVEDLDPVSNHDITGVWGPGNLPPDALQHLYSFVNLTPAASLQLVNDGDLKALRERRRRGLPDRRGGLFPHGALQHADPRAVPNFPGGYPMAGPGAPAPAGAANLPAVHLPIAGAALGGGIGALEAALRQGGAPPPGDGHGGDGARVVHGDGAQQLARIVGDGDGVAAAAASGPTDDARTLPILIGDDGVRFREFREGARMLQESAWSDWPVRGPRDPLD